MLSFSLQELLSRQTAEPLPRLISLLEPFGEAPSPLHLECCREVQLSFLYEAAKDRVLKARLEQIEPRALLEEPRSIKKSCFELRRSPRSGSAGRGEVTWPLS